MNYPRVEAAALGVRSAIKNAPDSLPGPPASLHKIAVPLRHCTLATLAIWYGRNGSLCHRSIRPLRAPIFLGVGTYPRSTPFSPTPAEASIRVAIYARVSTDEKGQDPENQLRELRAWCINSGHTVSHEYVERESGRKGADRRKQFAALSTPPQKENSIVYCSGRWTVLDARGWPKQLPISSASCRMASRFTVIPSLT
jgi:hypothetical protein